MWVSSGSRQEGKTDVSASEHRHGLGAGGCPAGMVHFDTPGRHTNLSPRGGLLGEGELKADAEVVGGGRIGRGADHGNVRLMVEVGVESEHLAVGVVGREADLDGLVRPSAIRAWCPGSL